MEKKRILHIRDSGGLFGGENVILTLAKNLDKSIFNLRLLCMKRSDGRSEAFINAAQRIGLAVDIMEVRGRFDRKAILSLRNYILSHRINLIHTHDFKSDFYGLLSTCSLDVKKISTAHGSTRDSPLKRFYLFFDERIVYPFFDRIIAVSEDLRSQLLGKLISPDKIEVIQNGLDIDLLARKDNGVKPELVSSATSGAKVFAVIGRLYPDKGHIFFIQAFASLAREHQNIIGIIVGDGPEKGNIERQIESFGLGERIQCSGVIEDIKHVYDSIDYLVIPSLTEGLPYVLLEAMASGIPVIATSVGDIPLLVQDGYTGYLVQAGDIEAMTARMRDLITMPEQARLMAERGKKMIEDQYLADCMVRKTEEVYLSLLSS